MSVDRWLHLRKSPSYNCAHFVSDVWEHETGGDVREALTGFLAPRAARQASHTLRRDLCQYQSPREPSIVLMRRPRCPPHVGIYLRGRCLHITDSGVQYQPIEIATLGFSIVGFYGNRYS